eukprot:4366456-Prymnesium_polylepis.1
MRLCEAENTKIFFFPPRAVRACRSINRVRSHRLDPSAMKQSSVCVCVTRLTSAQREANHARAIARGKQKPFVREKLCLPILGSGELP